MKFSVLKKRLLLVALVLLLLELLSFVKFIDSVKAVDRVIAEHIVITSQWSEIKLNRPLPASQTTHFIFLDVNNVELPVVVAPEIQFVDEYGRAYDLQAGEMTSAGNSVVIPFDLKQGAGSTNDTTYGRVRIRSNTQVQCNKITWRYRR